MQVKEINIFKSKKKKQEPNKESNMVYIGIHNDVVHGLLGGFDQGFKRCHWNDYFPLLMGGKDIPRNPSLMFLFLF